MHRYFAVVKNKALNFPFRSHWVLLGSILTMVVMSVAQTNNQAGQGFALRKLEIHKQELNEQIRQLSWEVGNYRSLEAVKNRAQALSLAAPKDVTFINASLETVAVAK